MARSKRASLVERATTTARRPHPARLFPGRREKRGYRVVSVSLYTEQASWLDREVTRQQNDGQPKASRSSVVQKLIDAAIFATLHKSS